MRPKLELNDDAQHVRGYTEDEKLKRHLTERGLSCRDRRSAQATTRPIPLLRGENFSRLRTGRGR